MDRLTLAAAAALIATAAAADDYEAAMRTYLDEAIRAWAADPALISAVVAQNAETRTLNATEIFKLDQLWRDEIGTMSTPTIDPVLNNPAADFLREQAADSAGLITEAFVMDARGLNVAVSQITSDYWQGDETKFIASFNRGKDAAHLSKIEFDESTGRYQGQVSIPLVDPASGAVVGALTVGLDAAMLLP